MSEIIKRPLQESIIFARLKTQWSALVQSVGGNLPLVDSEFAKMVQTYQSGESRSYHNLVHIGKVDEMLNKYRHLAQNFVALKFAGDGHDVIYIPGSATNEEDSASYMEKSMFKLGIPDALITETERIILLTKDHKTADNDTDGKLMIDADFVILASSKDEYDAYAQDIWQEYVGSGRVSEEAFKRRRRDLIKGWFKQDRLFLTDEIREQLQPLAKENLQRELARLT